jgi:hypothetical protein
MRLEGARLNVRQQPKEQQLRRTVKPIDRRTGQLPQREHHKERLGLVCGGCAELIPPGNAYTPEQYIRYFGMPYAEAAPHPVFETAEMRELKERDRLLWIEHERARLAYTDAVFQVEDLKRGRAGSRGTDADGAVGARFGVDIRAAEERREQLHEGCSAIVQEINKLSWRRKWLHEKALWQESYPPDATAGSIGVRIAAAIRGGSA